jgi:hypothetical protein
LEEGEKKKEVVSAEVLLAENFLRRPESRSLVPPLSWSPVTPPKQKEIEFFFFC